MNKDKTVFADRIVSNNQEVIFTAVGVVADTEQTYTFTDGYRVTDGMYSALIELTIHDDKGTKNVQMTIGDALNLAYGLEKIAKDTLSKYRQKDPRSAEGIEA